MNESDEVYDIVDADDKVVGRASRAEIHAKGLLHRSVHIMVFNPRGDLFLQKRAPAKDENPGLWDTSSAGHVDSGEDYAAAAHRELREELGIAGDLHPLMTFRACRETCWEHVAVFSCTTSKTITINPLEISEGRYWTLGEIQGLLSRDPGQFTSSFKLIFFNYLKENN